MIEKLLAKLNAKISNLNPIGGEPTLTQSDVAYLLSGLNQIQHLFAQSYYLEENRSTNLFTRVVAEKRCVEHQFVRGAYFEFFMPKHCGKCKSTGTVAAKNCPQCCGSGLGRYSDEQRAKLISVDRNNPHTRKYYKKRENVYQELIEYFNHLERTVVNNVYSKLIEPEEKSIISSVDY